MKHELDWAAHFFDKESVPMLLTLTGRPCALEQYDLKDNSILRKCPTAVSFYSWMDPHKCGSK